MSIQSEIMRLQTAKTDIGTAIVSKGVTVPVGTTLAAMPPLISSMAIVIEDGSFLTMLTNTGTIKTIPSDTTVIGAYAYYGNENFLSSITSLPSGITSIGTDAFYNCSSLTTLRFQGTPTSIQSTSFNNCTNLTIINVPWSSGAVANAPWGATNATINYNYTP